MKSAIEYFDEFVVIDQYKIHWKGTTDQLKKKPTKLITLKLKYILGISDVVIYDALVNRSVLKLCHRKAILIYAGKTKKQSCTQSDINNLMIKYANQNKRVLRLKGGDVSFFSRGSQEVEFLKKNKINFQVFSAISSSQASLNAINQNFFD